MNNLEKEIYKKEQEERRNREEEFFKVLMDIKGDIDDIKTNLRRVIQTQNIDKHTKNIEKLEEEIKERQQKLDLVKEARIDATYNNYWY